MSHRRHERRLAAVVLLAACCFTGCLDRYEGGTAPDGSPSQRHAWGIAKLGATYFEGAQWVKNSEMVQADVGRIVTISPIGRNSCLCAFTDGCSCSIFFEVVGEKGTGRFEMRSAFTDTLSRKLHFGIGFWSFGERKIRVPGITTR